MATSDKAGLKRTRLSRSSRISSARRPRGSCESRQRTLRRVPALVALLATAMAMVSAGCGGAAEQADASTTPQATSDEYEAEHAPDGSLVTLSGTVVAQRPDGFLLDFGDGTLRVEMDDYDPFPEDGAILENDQVVVSGFIDDDFFEQRTLEASSVYVESLGMHFYANGADEEEHAAASVAYVAAPTVEMTGVVTYIGDGHFRLDVGGGERVDVDVDGLAYDPLDEEGYQKVRVGDRVRVRGTLDYDVFTAHDLDATAVVSVARPT